ncbi:RNA polymerase sigma factor, partial [Cellulosimicrobium cellulans]|uniref:RNA polymerase sigma factor n=1 Tax=Cellulosimicrobium cellulans TaxID=1710 RepID=UPI0008491F43
MTAPARPVTRGGRADEPGRRAVEAVWRIESARIVGALARYTGDVALAEDLAQEALAEALVAWPRDGVPASPAGWLLTVGRRRAIDAFRRRAALDERYAALARGLEEGGTGAGAPSGTGGDDAGVLWDPDRVDDDVLALVLVACHPVLSREAQVALTLRVVAGLSSDEIARAFLVPTATVQARITRAKKTLAAAGVPFAVPPREERRERLGGVLAVLYVIFTEGSTATSGDDWLRPDLAHEALRLARVLVGLVPDEPEAHALLALLELTAARFPARTGPDGEPVLLADQDRRRWDRSAVRRGRAAL